jgi:hypothetical protein
VTARFLDAIDWRRPWLTPFRATAEPIIGALDWRVAVNELAMAAGLCNHLGLPIQFVPQANLPPETAYEAFISATGGVPTRDNLHDFFNALVWLTFPSIKSRLNALQASEISKADSEPSGMRSEPRRGKVRDAATIFDENAALIVFPDSGLANALRAHNWREIFMTRRDTFERQSEAWLFGHALIEKLVNPYKAITAHAWPLVVDPAYFSLSQEEKRIWLDNSVSRQLSKELTTGQFTPLPVLGIPDWWVGQDAAFYADQGVFRPARQR